MFNLFKKQKTSVNHTEDLCPKSRLNFAFNPELIRVYKFYLKPKFENKLSDMMADNVFVCNGIVEYKTNNSIYPIFKMPKKLPATRTISTKKIICIGALIVDNTSREIEGLTSDFTGMSLDDINSSILNTPIDNNTLVSIMYIDGPVCVEEVEGDDIDIETYERSVTLDNSIMLLLDDNVIAEYL